MKIKKIIGITLTTLLLSSTVFANTTTYQAVSNPFGLYINGKAITSDQPILNYNNFTYVPLRLVSQNLNASVDLNNNNIVINSNEINTNNKQFTNDTYYKDLFYLYEALVILERIEDNAQQEYFDSTPYYYETEIYYFDNCLNRFNSNLNSFKTVLDKKFCNEIASYYNLDINSIFNKLETQLNKYNIVFEDRKNTINSYDKINYDMNIVDTTIHSDILNLQSTISNLIYN